MNDDHPEVIRAKAEAKERILKARATLHPVTQIMYVFWDDLGNLVGSVGCLITIVILILAIFAPQVFSQIFGN